MSAAHHQRAHWPDALDAAVESDDSRAPQFAMAVCATALAALLAFVWTDEPTPAPALSDAVQVGGPAQAGD